jgi:hypothetical protein
MDPYSRLQAQSFDERDYIGCSSGFLSWFGRPGFGSTQYSDVASVVDIDIIRGNRRTAALVPRGMISRPLGPTQADTAATRYTAFSRRFPLSLEMGSIAADQLEFRGVGENPYMPADHLTRLRRLALDHHKEQVKRTVRLFEVLAAQSILTGVQDAIIGGGAANQYDFCRNATHSFAAVASWGVAGSNIVRDIEHACTHIRTDASVNPDFMLLGQTAMTGMLANTALLATSNNFRFNFVNLGGVSAGGSVVGPTSMPAKFQPMVDGGMIFRGTLETPQGFVLAVFTYMDTYTDGTGTVQPLMPLTDCLIGSSQAICDRYFGPPERIPMTPTELADRRFYFGIEPGPSMVPALKGGSDIITPSMFYFDAYKSGRREITIETQSAPIFVPTMTDAWATIDCT